MSTANIDFKSLHMRDALDLAILIEDEAKDRYEELASQMEIHHTPEAGVFFRSMVENEIRHAEQLVARREALFADEPRTVTREMLWDVEAPEYDEVRISMTRRQALEVALRAEEKAHAFFEAALPHAGDPEVQELFAELLAEEAKHRQMVQAQLDREPPDPPVSPSDYEDEPVAQ